MNPTIRVTLVYDISLQHGDTAAEIDCLNNDTEYQEDFMNRLLENSLDGVTIAKVEVV